MRSNKLKIGFSIICLFTMIHADLRAQTNEFKDALDSLNYYLSFTSFSPLNESPKIRLVTQYNPLMSDGMGEGSSDEIYKNRAAKNKQIIFLTDNRDIYIIDLKKIKISFITKSQNESIRITDPKGKLDFIYTLVVREWNGKGGRLEKEIKLFPYPPDKASFIHDKLDFFFKKVILTSRKAK